MIRKGCRFGIREKIAYSMILCQIVFVLIVSVFMVSYMQRIVNEKIENIDALSANVITTEIDTVLEQAQTLSLYCANSIDVIHVLSCRSLDEPGAMRLAIDAQNAVNDYLRTLPIDKYINKLCVFNSSGVFVHAVSNYYGTLRDLENIQSTDCYQAWREGRWQPFMHVDRSVNVEGADCFVLLAPVYPVNSVAPIGVVYVELDTRLITDITAAYNQTDRYIIETGEGNCLISQPDSSFLSDFALREEPDSFRHGETLYRLRHYSLRSTSALSLTSCINQTAQLASQHSMLTTIVCVIVILLLVFAAVLLLLTRHITVPINHLITKINKIAMNDFSVDPELEKPRNELGEVGARLNELGLAVDQLLKNTVALHDERTEIEMALLQSQVNPHFLYNTLNSVHYMAVMQKNIGIETMVHALVRLLKNVSKGVSDRIPLSEELSLLNDYIQIQSIRYIGTFEYVCNVPPALMDYRIIKFTLQPLVENAIFHGIAPKGTLGTITVDAYEDGDDLVVTVTDDGVGMTQEEIDRLLSSRDRVASSSLSGIGMYNVNRRLKMAYGRHAGLTLESVKGEYTVASVRIVKER